MLLWHHRSNSIQFPLFMRTHNRSWVSSARWVGNYFNDGLYDIHIHLNCVPLLEADTGMAVGPWEQNRAQDVLLAKDVMAPVGPSRCCRSAACLDSATIRIADYSHLQIIIIGDLNQLIALKLHRRLLHASVELSVGQLCSLLAYSLGD